MKVRLAINGMGRIGRAVLRAAFESQREDLEIVAVNSRANNEITAHLLRYDTIHGRFPYDIQLGDGEFIINGHSIKTSSEADPASINWQDLDIDVVLECTGVFTKREQASIYLKQAGKKVLVSAPSEGADLTIVYGVNHHLLKAEHKIVSNASCTTNCLAPVAKVLDEAVGIKNGFMTTIHSYTSDQPVLDKAHRDFYRARAAACSIIPTTTGAAKAVGLVLENLKGRLDGVSIRVPTPNVSMIDFVFNANRATSAGEINAALKHASETNLKNVLSYCEEKLVSSDFIHDAHSAIFVSDQTRIIEDDLCRVAAWYDNEWGFSNRMLDSAVAMAKL